MSREKGLVSFRFFAVGNGPLCGSTQRLPNFSRRAPICCWKNEKPSTLRLGLQITPNITFLKRNKSPLISGIFLFLSWDKCQSTSSQRPTPKNRRSYSLTSIIETHTNNWLLYSPLWAQPRERCGSDRPHEGCYQPVSQEQEQKYQEAGSPTPGQVATPCRVGTGIH